MDWIVKDATGRKNEIAIWINGTVIVNVNLKNQ